MLLCKCHACVRLPILRAVLENIQRSCDYRPTVWMIHQLEAKRWLVSNYMLNDTVE